MSVKYFLISIFLILPFSFLSPAHADCTSVQLHNKGSVNNNCNNNENSQNQSQSQDNNQTVNVSVPQVFAASTVTVLPHTGPQDFSLYSLALALPVGFYLRKKAKKK